jgi:hypothetical protein
MRPGWRYIEQAHSVTLLRSPVVKSVGGASTPSAGAYHTLKHPQKESAIYQGGFALGKWMPYRLHLVTAAGTPTVLETPLATIEQAMNIACAALRNGATDAWVADDDDKKAGRPRTCVTDVFLTRQTGLSIRARRAAVARSPIDSP